MSAVVHLLLFISLVVCLSQRVFAQRVCPMNGALGLSEQRFTCAVLPCLACDGVCGNWVRVQGNVTPGARHLTRCGGGWTVRLLKCDAKTVTRGRHKHCLHRLATWHDANTVKSNCRTHETAFCNNTCVPTSSTYMYEEAFSKRVACSQVGCFHVELQHTCCVKTLHP